MANLGDDGYSKKLVKCRFSASVKLLMFIIPLFMVSGFVAVSGPKIYTWDFISSPAWIWRTEAEKTVSVSQGKESEGVVDLHATVVVAGVQNTEKEEATSDDSVLNSSFTPRIPDEAVHFEAPNATTENGLNSSRSEIIVAELSRNEIHDHISVKSQDPREYSNLERLEAGLQKARVAIKEAKDGNQIVEDSDYVPDGPMYWNARVLHRSYLEMEKQLKVYVYREGEPPVFHNGPCKSIYSMEGNFIHMMEMNTQFRTRDPEKAHLFFLPFSVVMMVKFVYVRSSHDFESIKRTVRDYVKLVATKYPYWNRSLGADHFMLSCHDWGPRSTLAVPHLANNAIRALCNANTSERFKPIKDVSFPEVHLPTGTTKGLIGGPSPSKRPILAFFAGALHGHIRSILLEQWENKDDDIQVNKYLPKGISYYDMMRKSKFCLCPSGNEVASPRIVEAFYTGCVPVLISAHYVPPFSDVLNWKTFSVEVPVRDIPKLKEILNSIPPGQYIRMQRRLVKIRRHFEVNSPPRRYDVFHMILHSIWLRRLNVKIQDLFAMPS